MADNLGREAIPGVAGASGCPHPTQLPIPIRWRNRGKPRQVDGALQAPPQPLDKDVVHAAALAIHADCDAAMLEHAGELGASELAALIGVEDLGLAVPCQGVLQGLDAEIGAERVRQPPGRTARLCQSMIATRYRNPLAIG